MTAPRKAWQRPAEPEPPEGALCHRCEQPFATLDEWEWRHSDPDGEDVHEACCVICNPALDAPE